MLKLSAVPRVPGKLGRHFANVRTPYTSWISNLRVYFIAVWNHPVLLIINGWGTEATMILHVLSEQLCILRNLNHYSKHQWIKKSDQVCVGVGKVHVSSCSAGGGNWGQGFDSVKHSSGDHHDSTYRNIKDITYPYSPSPMPFFVLFFKTQIGVLTLRTESNLEHVFVRVCVRVQRGYH